MKIKQRIQTFLSKIHLRGLGVPFLALFARSGDIARESIVGLLLASHGPQIDPQLFRFLIQVTALQAKRFRGQAHVLMTALQLRENHFTFE